MRDPQCDQHGPGGREQHENTAISARHGLARGAGADELAHQQREVVAGDVKQVSLVHVLAAPKPGPAHAAAIEVVGEGALDDLGASSLKASLATPDNSRVRLLVTARRAASSPRQRAKPFALGSEIRVFHGPLSKAFKTARE